MSDKLQFVVREGSDSSTTGGPIGYVRQTKGSSDQVTKGSLVGLPAMLLAI